MSANPGIWIQLVARRIVRVLSEWTSVLWESPRIEDRWPGEPAFSQTKELEEKP